MIEMTRKEKSELLQDTFIDWMDASQKNKFYKHMLEVLTTKQKDDLIQFCSNEFNTEVNNAARSIGLID